MRLIAADPGENKASLTTIAAGLVVLWASVAAHGQYTLTYSSTPAGGGRCTGGVYSLLTAVGPYAGLDDSSTAQAPTPNPMDWATAPYATGQSTITMMAAQAQDPSGGVQYYFQNVTVSNGSHDSGWQDSRTYTDAGLNPDTVYEYRVRARGSMRVETAYSLQLPARTHATLGDTPEGSAEPVSGELGNDLSLQVNPFTGSVGYTLPIALPPARQGSEPALALRYGGGGNGWCGVGWSLGMGAIQRDTRKGVPVARNGATFLSKYDDAKGFVVAFGAVNSRLVQVNPTTHEYRAETDHAFLKYEYDAAYDPNGLWTVTDKSGNKFYFGRVPGEFAGRAAGAAMKHPLFTSTTKGDNAFFWALAKIQDINGNLTYIYYVQDGNQLYLDEIRYNGHTYGQPDFSTTHSVQFVREDREDKSISYGTGYRVETNKRLKEIQVKVFDKINTPNQWIRVRSYHLAYETSPSTLRSLLTSVKMCGTGAPNLPGSYLPPVTFEYQEDRFGFDPPIDWSSADGQGQTDDRWNSLIATAVTEFTRTAHFPDTNEEEIPCYYDSTHVALCDLNGDALPDRVMRKYAGYAPPNNVLKVQFNTGSGFGALQDWGPLDAQGHITDSEAQLWNSPRAAWTDIYTGEPVEVRETIPGHHEWVLGHYEWVDGQYVWVPTQFVWIPARDVYNYHLDYQQAQEIPVDLVDINGDGFPDRVMRKAGYNFAVPSNNVFRVQSNTGTGFSTSVNWGPLYAFDFLACQLGDYDDHDWYMRAKAYNSVGTTHIAEDCFPTLVCLTDMNCDGLPDRVLYKYGDMADTLKIQFNSGNGFEQDTGSPVVTLWGPVSSQGSASSVWLSPRLVDLGQETTIDLVDINGDGLPDRVMRKRLAPYNCFVVQFNTGWGFEKDENGAAVLRNWEPIDGQGDTTTCWNSLQGVMIADGTFFVDFFDINCDGLPDRVMREETGDEGGTQDEYDVFKVQLNTGTGFQKNGEGSAVFADWTGIDDQGMGTANWGSPHGVTKAEHAYSNTYATMCDINGDGLPDRIMRKKASPYNVFKVQLNKGPVPDLLSKVKGRLGGSVEVAYKSSTDPQKHKDTHGVNRLPFPVQVASLVDVNDGFGNRVLTQYDYSRGFFNAARKEFSGFGLTTVKQVRNGASGLEDAGTTTKAYFHQGGGYEDPDSGEWQDAGSVGKRGMPYRVEVYGNDGMLYTLTTNKVEEVNVVPETETGWRFAYVSQTTTVDYNETTYRAKVQKWEYDTTTGNLVTSLDLGEVTLGTTPQAVDANLAAHMYSDLTDEDNVYVHNRYAVLDNPAILNKIEMTKTTSDVNGVDRLTQAFYTYDPNGRVLTEILWLDKDREGPTGPNDCNAAPLQYAYDDYGNRVLSIDRAGIETTTTYDPNYHMFPIETTVGSFVTSIDFDVLSGLPIRTMDPADMVAENVYDSFYRLTDVYVSPGPNAPATIWQTHIDYDLGGIADGVSYNCVHQVHTGYEAYIYSDGLGRIVQTRVKDVVSTPQRYRVATTSFDELGRVHFQTLPFFSNGQAFTSATGQPGTLTEYDAVGRVWKVTPPAGETGSPTRYVITAYSDANDPWVQVFTDAEEKVTKRYFDAFGRTVQVREVTSGGEIITHFEYDRLGRLIATIDHANNEFLAEYDSLGRKIRSIDPDMGEWSYLYDDAGRMVEQEDARSNRIQFSYDDEIGRVSQKRTYDHLGQLAETITYAYDTSNDPEYVVHKGQIYEVNDSQGWTRTGYDSRGRAIKSSRYVQETDHIYTTQTEYDTAGRVAQITYPDTKAVIAQSYDSAGHLTKVESLWGTGVDVVFYQASAFNEDDQPTVLNYGNGVSTQAQFYTAPRRLKRSYASTATGTIQDITYAYDKASNIKGVADAAHPSGQSSCSLSNIQYDDLHRLISLVSTSESRTITYEYTALGNINKNGEMGTGTYTYHATKVHAVTAANGSTYAYDACGNMTTRNLSGKPNQTLTYDEQNRLKQVAVTGGNTITFGYSAGGSRLWKKANGEVRGLWIGALYEEKDGQILCHVYAGGRLVASFEPESGFACFIQHHPYLAAIWNFGDSVLTALFGGGRAPFSVMALAILAGGYFGLTTEDGNRQRRRRNALRKAGGLFSPSYVLTFLPSRTFRRQVVLVTLAASVFLSSNPQEAYAGTPVYDPVFYYYHPDHLGSSQLMTDRDGDVVQQYGYSPFGRENYKSNIYAFSISSRYTGQTLDEDTGLYYYGTRYYDPELARFIQADSIVPDPGRSHAYNRYTYCYNNPLRLTDPTGNTPTSIYDVPMGTYEGTVSTGGGWGDFAFDWDFSFDWSGLGSSSSSSSTALTSTLTGAPTSSGTDWMSAYGLTPSGGGPYPSGKYGELLRKRDQILNSPPWLLNAEDIAALLPSAYDLRKAAFEDAGYSESEAEFYATNMLVLGPFARIEEGIMGVRVATAQDLTGLNRLLHTTAGGIDAALELGCVYALGRAPTAPAAVDSTTARLQSHVIRAARQVDALGDAALTPAQRAAARSNRNLRAPYRGNRIDVMARKNIMQDPSLSHLEGSYNRGVDFRNPATGDWWDMTTPREWPGKVQKYGPGGTLLSTE